MKLTQSDAADFSSYSQGMTETDLVAVCGAGGITDVFPTFSNTVLDTLDRGNRRGIPTAIFSHGLGPLRSPELSSRAKAILPKVDLIALRERRSGLPLLMSFGVDPSRVMITGDDAIETAYKARSSRIGTAIGVNIRTMEPSGVNDELIQRLRPLLHEFARRYSAPLISIPIARQHSVDFKAIQQVLHGYESQENSTDDLDSPIKVIEQAARCRIVVTGAYHAAVFALAQGIPAVCLANHEYFANKFLGLAHLFGAGCETVFLDDQNWSNDFKNALTRAWDSAEQLRARLLESAAKQVELSRSAYSRVSKFGSLRKFTLSRRVAA
jgi:colanic acid/amylovoran biosynthesis protein